MNLTTLVSTIIHSEANLDYSINRSVASTNIIFEIQDEGNQPIPPGPLPEGDWLLASNNTILASTDNDYFTWKNTKQVIEDNLSK